MAEQAQAQAEQQAKEYAHREIDRIAKEAENAQRKQAVENKAKLEAERLEALRVADAEATLEQARLQAEQERIEAEHKLIEEAEQAKIRAEAAVKAEADAKQKEKLEQAAKTQAKESAMLEIASIVRKAEEDRKKAAAKVKEEKLEAKRKAKADKDAADKARHEVLQLAEEAERTEKKLAESIRVNAEESVKQQAENQALEKSKQERQEYKYQQAADGIRAKAEAEEQAQIEAKENARLEMERIGHEAEAVRQKQLVEQHQAQHKKSLPKLDDFDAAEAAEEAIFEAEERAAEAEKKVARDVDKTALQAKEDADRAEIKQTAKADAARKQKLQASTQSHHSAKYVKKLTLMLAKLVLVYLPVVLLLVVGLLHFVNISMLIAPIEKVATETVGVPVKVTKVHASVWPQPHLVLEGVTMGTASGNQKIEAIHVLPVVSSLFEDVKIVKSLVIEGLNVQQDNFGQALTWIDKVGTAKNLKLEQVNLKNLTFNIQDLPLESFDGQLIFTELHVLKNIDLVSSSNALFVMISPQAGSYDISLKAANWPLPFNPKVIFNTLDAKGTISQNQIEFSQITGEMYGGNLAAKAIINLPQNDSQWSTTGSFSLTKADTPLLLTAFNSAVSVDGKLNLNGSFTSQSAMANKLAQAANITADFDISQGSIGDIELARAVIARGSQSLAGDATDFDRLTGTVKINQGQYQYAKLALASPQFRANGYLNINANEIVSGKINADLAAQSRRLQANFTVTGRGKDLKSN